MEHLSEPAQQGVWCVTPDTPHAFFLPKHQRSHMTIPFIFNTHSDHKRAVVCKAASAKDLYANEWGTHYQLH